MICQACGTPNPDAATKCGMCGVAQWSSDSASASPGALAGIPSAVPREHGRVVRMLIPIGRSPWALIAGYAGLLSLLLVPGPFAILFGILAIRDLRRNPHLHGMGRAVFGVVAGVLGTIGLLLVWINRLSK